MKNLNSNPDYYRLSGRTKLQALGEQHLAIVKKRKSRIIMKDGLQILEQQKLILEKEPTLKVSLLISGPICSKTIKFLQKNGIEIVKH